MFANELANDVVKREHEKRAERGEWSQTDRAAEAARVQELAARFYSELTRAEDRRKEMSAGSHRAGLRVGVSESVESFSKAIGERFRALHGRRSRTGEG
jgi:hypothetical protein